MQNASLNEEVGEQVQNALSEESENTELEVKTCGCVELQTSGLNNFVEFQHEVRKGLKDFKTRDIRYDHIEMLMVTWMDSDVPEVAKHAKELGDILEKEPYKFGITRLEINHRSTEQEDINLAFKSAIEEAEKRVSTKDSNISNLFILYYGGHGEVSKDASRRRVWQPRRVSSKASKHLLWHRYAPRMYDFGCDVMYLFDCCYALAMVETLDPDSLNHRRRSEILCSSGLMNTSGAVDKKNFTQALKDILQKKAKSVLEGEDAIGGLTFESICDIMKGPDVRRHLAAEPRWEQIKPKNNKYQGLINMAKKGAQFSQPLTEQQFDRRDSGHNSLEARGLSETRILIKIRLTEPAENLSSSDWLEWLKGRPHNVAAMDLAVVKTIEWVGVFESDSSLALMTVPVWLWHSIQHNPACQSLGVVRSENMLRKILDHVEEPVKPVG